MIAWMSQTSVFYKRWKQFNSTSKGRFLYDLKNYADAHMTLILWWRCNYGSYLLDDDDDYTKLLVYNVICITDFDTK